MRSLPTCWQAVLQLDCRSNQWQLAAPQVARNSTSQQSLASLQVAWGCGQPAHAVPVSPQCQLYRVLLLFLLLPASCPSTHSLSHSHSHMLQHVTSSSSCPST